MNKYSVRNSKNCVTGLKTDSREYKAKRILFFKYPSIKYKKNPKAKIETKVCCTLQ